MIDYIFNSLYGAMNGSVFVVLGASLTWGVLSIILSPCHLSSIPLVVGYIISQGKLPVRNTYKIALVFSIGLLITIALIGIITASLGRLMGDIGVIGNYLVASIFLIVGLYLLDIIKLEWNNTRFLRTKRTGLSGAFILGLLFGLALGPCTFAYMAPVLGVVFQTAQSNYFTAILYLLAFAVGHCSVIVAAGSFTGKIRQYLDWSEGSKVIILIKKICGILVIGGGIYLVYTTL
ncbi:MAG: cytochrome C biogenesis protein [Ignavibacteriaceae bacterium]|nr:cytochrome C biogenesis protein [Ignavibacteriaceae bacterium]